MLTKFITSLSSFLVKTEAEHPNQVVDLNASIARCQAKLATATGDAKCVLLGLIQRLQDDVQSLMHNM